MTKFTIKQYLEGILPLGYLFNKVTITKQTMNNMKNVHQGNHQIKRVINNLRVNTTTEGETLEQQIERMVSNKEPITNGDPLMYTERKEGVKAETNIRTDRFEIAVEAHSKIHASYSARREERRQKEDNDKGPEDAKTETPAA